MKMRAATAPLAILRSMLLQQAALRDPQKSRSYTARGPGVMPHAKTQPFRWCHGRAGEGKKVLRRVARLQRPEPYPGTLDYDTLLRKEQWLKKQRP